MVKKVWWPLEVILITCYFGLILVCIVFAVSHNYIGFVSGFAANVMACFIFLLFVLYKLKVFTKERMYLLQTIFKNKIRFKDVVIILLIFPIGKGLYNLIMKLEFVHFFGIKAMQQNSALTDVQAWLMIILLILFIPIIAFSEELYFRVYLFSLQYPKFGKCTWLINGASWSIFHLFTTTNFLALLPTCLMYSYVYQRRRNIWLTISAHLINNFIAFYPVLKTYLK